MPGPAQDGAYRFGEFTMSPADRCLYHGLKSVALQPKAFDLLHLLVRKHASLVSREEIIHSLWPTVHVTEANLTNIIVSLRKILGREAIQTVSKFGYRFTLTVTAEPEGKHSSYASFVRGKELLNQKSLESIVAARDFFWICLAEDPQFAPAWAWLGRTCRLLEKFKGEPPTVPSLPEAAFQRAFLLDPDLACAHQFYTPLQVDSGHALDAMIRLASRLKKHGPEPEALAGLVHVLRACGLLDESVAAHERALILDPTVKTSVAHTYFLMGEYARVFETYIGNQFYLDAAAWAALGNREHAISLLRARLIRPELGLILSSMMTSLLAALEGRLEDAVALTEETQLFEEPEALIYFARHLGMLNAVKPAVEMIRRARLDGFCSPTTLENDIAFVGIRHQPEFIEEFEACKQLTANARAQFQQHLGPFLQTLRHSKATPSVLTQTSSE